MALAAGHVLGRYRLIEKAGVGGMSEVWKGEDQTLHRTVAVKVIHAPVAADPTYRERFLREARLVAGLEHPNVLPVYDFGTAPIGGEEVSYLVMPYVAGGSLKGRITGPIPYPLAVAWLSAVAAALDHAHAHGILHRDVKPANVLLDSHDRPMLADFGLARSAESTSGLTATGTVLGTPLYMSPEQATGADLDGRADQYALAIIAFELLTGRVPFRADSPLAVLHQHVATPPAPITSVVPGTPPAVDAVMARALAKEPAKRFESCAAFVGALASALGVPLAALTIPQARATAAVTARIEGPSEASRAATVISGGAAAPPPLASPVSVATQAPGAPLKALAIAGLLVAVAAALWLVFRRPKESVPPPLQAPSPAATVVPTTVPTATAVAAESPSPPAPPPTVPPAPPSTSGRIAPRLPPREPLLGSGSQAGDTSLAEAWEALDDTRHANGRLSREDFVEAMGGARRVLATRPTRGARFLDAFARAGVAFADGRNAEAWQLLNRALEETPQERGRTLRFVREEVGALGPNPGPDANWVMGLAFADVRGDLSEEIGKAGERSPGSPRVWYARALFARSQGRAIDAGRYASKACQAGLREACGLAR